MLATEKARIDDSTQKANAAKIKPADTIAARIDSLHRDSVNKISAAGNFTQGANGTEQLIVVENNVLKATFSNKGGMLKNVQLKNFKSIDSTPVMLSGGKEDELGYSINTGSNQSAKTSSLFFSGGAITKNSDGSQTITYTLADSAGQSITHQYIIKPDNYMIDWNVMMNGADKLLTQNSLNMHWAVEIHQHQIARAFETQKSMLGYYNDDGYDYSTAASGYKGEFDKSVQWVAFKQQFFNTTLIAPNKFVSGKALMNVLPDTLTNLYTATAELKVQAPAASSVSIPFKLYYGPNDYKLLQQYDNGMENLVDLGSGIYSFVKYINRWIILPVFNFFTGLIGHYGWVIFLLTLFIRLVTSPLTYSSYLSGAKMRVLRPELDTLKKKFPEQQAFAVEQMKLFREAGVNPLGGCIPALLQIPIFFALFSFFSSNIELRGQSFLWAKDLSSYDVLVQLPFTVPLGFGDHISLFTLTAVITSFLISIYNMAMTPQQDNPALKYMPYIFPFILLFIFNRLPSALTWYYTVSNVVTLGIQFVIQRYIINHEKILAQIDAKRSQPKQKSKFSERMEQMMEQQKKIQEMKQKTKK